MYSFNIYLYIIGWWWGFLLLLQVVAKNGWKKLTNGIKTLLQRYKSLR